MQKDQLRTLIVTLPTTGDNTVIAANQLGPGVGSIKVWQLELNSTAANTITPKSGATVIPGQIFHTANGSSTTWQATGAPWWTVQPGQPLVLNATVGGVTTGALYFSLA